MKKLGQHLFKFLYEITILNNKAILINYEETIGCSSFDILFEGSKNLPRKKKKLIRRLLEN